MGASLSSGIGSALSAAEAQRTKRWACWKNLRSGSFVVHAPWWELQELWRVRRCRQARGTYCIGWLVNGCCAVSRRVVCVRACTTHTRSVCQSHRHCKRS